ncbi:family 78 glycoside hydrolase catalytic domain [Streptomyces griseiscabiei]|uniref:Family 78 glycoside hydrolase catalytic domain n=1 Tax=Streptomyces griseiscabiei TaxID=2993540 RepID=A0ABU4L437_9ACTN|nr:family 78 glycoside hydrolase catalytic domain [Streptomyces griseiscabiei]MBZ3905392.1 family 78 glycoside hydrolase catalytic domain [Streptomyces griseiscabiei]MDX2910481.1 family 78 glycoside hydrolase catalytic domain [Streptomyces griseiscabiei]
MIDNLAAQPPGTDHRSSAHIPGALRDTAWRAHWIGPHTPDHGPGPEGFGPPDTRGPFGRYLFRTTFTLDAVPQAIPARITADSRYVVHLNGREAGRGPVRSQPRRLAYDTLDLAPLAHAGENTLVVLVTYYGKANSFWQPAAANGALGRDAVLVLEADLGDRLLVTDDTWRVLASDAWHSPEAEGMDGIPVECLDARLLPSDWKSGVPDADWQKARIVPALHLGSLARSTPPADPYGPLRPRPIGPLGGDTVTPVRIAVSPPAAVPDDPHPVGHVRTYLSAPELPDPVVASLPLTLAPGTGRAQHVVVDMGRIVCGFVRLDLTAPCGTQVDLMYRETPHVPGANDPFSAPNTGARYIARGHDDSFEACEVNGFRYLHALVTSDGPARIDAVGVREHLYPRAGAAYFRSSDPELDALYTAGVRTVALTSHDAFVDCPTREQRAWVGDAVVHQMVQLATSTDWRPAWHYLDLANSPRPDGILPMSVVGEIEQGGGTTIPDWSLHWLHGVHNLYRHGGQHERDRLAELAPTARRILAWYLPFRTDDGVLSDLPEWNLVDWSSVFTTGASSIVTALWARGLREYAEISTLLRNDGEASWAQRHWERACKGYEMFWDERRGTYVDHLLSGVQQPPASQIAGAAAIASGLAPATRHHRIIDRIMDPGRLVTRSWIGGEGGYDAEKINDEMHGVRRIDWDPEEQVVRAQPFLSYLVHDAAALTGRVPELVGALRRWSRFLHDGYDTFGECWGWGTPAHGWSSTPARDLMTYVLGVTPAEPGFGRARVAPAYGVVERAEGAVPTRDGLLHVAFDSSGVEIDSPVPLTLRLPGGQERSYGTGHTRVPFI